MSYSWNPHIESYKSYLVHRNQLKEQLLAVGLPDASRMLAKEIVSGISEQTLNILGSVGKVISNLDFGTSEMERALESGFGHISKILDSGFAGLLRSTNQIKQELQRLVELVELEEQKKATENFRYAVFALNRQLWNEASEYLTSAIEGDQYSKGYKLDWHFHWVKGELLLGSPASHDWPGIDPAEAEQAFLSAARYAKADEPEEAAKSMLMASVAAFVQSSDDPTKLSDMFRHAGAAYKLDSGLTEACFQTGKALMALGSPEKALPVLRLAITQDIKFAIRAAEDPNYKNYEKMLNKFFESLRQETIQELKPRFKNALDELEPYLSVSKKLASGDAAYRLKAGKSDDLLEWDLITLWIYRVKGPELDLKRCKKSIKILEKQKRQELSARAKSALKNMEPHISVGELASESSIKRLNFIAKKRMTEWNLMRLVSYEKEDFHKNISMCQTQIEELKKETLSIIVPKAKEELYNLSKFIEKSDEFASSDAVKTLKRAASGNMEEQGLSSLLQYNSTGMFDTQKNLKRIRNRYHIERRVVPESWEEEIEVEEPYSFKEEYWSDLVIEPKKWWRDEVTEAVKQTYVVQKIRKVKRNVKRQSKRECLVLINAFGEEYNGSDWAFIKIPPRLFQKKSDSSRLSYAFEIGISPVTQSEYKSVMGFNPSNFKGPTRPVERVSWFEAIEYCNALSKKHGLDEAYEINGESVHWRGLDCKGYRLPTEAEWEYACRAGSTTERVSELDSFAWYEKNSENETHPVRQKQPNAWGLYDMLGNVWEWCWDWCDSSYQKEKIKDSVGDSVGPSSSSRRVYRGGCWNSGPSYVCASYRLWGSCSRSDFIGFRLTRSLPVNSE